MCESFPIPFVAGMLWDLSFFLGGGGGGKEVIIPSDNFFVLAFRLAYDDV